MPTQQPIQHYLMFSDLQAFSAHQTLEIVGDEAHHAVRVKRLRTQSPVGILDMQGRVGVGLITEIMGSKSKPKLAIELRSVELFPKPSPCVDVLCALPKGDRLDRMIDQLSQLGVSSFAPLLCDRSQRKPEAVRFDKLDRIAIEAAKQCHRPWKLEIHDSVAFADAIQDPDALIADGSGQPPAPGSVSSRIALLIGPEGGWSDGEREMFSQACVPVHRFGQFVLRTEAAACAASAIVLGSSQSPQGE